jgi:hypothetical protein
MKYGLTIGQLDCMRIELLFSVIGLYYSNSYFHHCNGNPMSFTERTTRLGR